MNIVYVSCICVYKHQLMLCPFLTVKTGHIVTSQYTSSFYTVSLRFSFKKKSWKINAFNNTQQITFQFQSLHHRYDEPSDVLDDEPTAASQLQVGAVCQPHGACQGLPRALPPPEVGGGRGTHRYPKQRPQQDH